MWRYVRLQEPSLYSSCLSVVPSGTRRRVRDRSLCPGYSMSSPHARGRSLRPWIRPGRRASFLHESVSPVTDVLLPGELWVCSSPRGAERLWEREAPGSPSLLVHGVPRHTRIAYVPKSLRVQDVSHLRTRSARVSVSAGPRRLGATPQTRTTCASVPSGSLSGRRPAPAPAAGRAA